MVHYNSNNYYGIFQQRVCTDLCTKECNYKLFYINGGLHHIIQVKQAPQILDIR